MHFTTMEKEASQYKASKEQKDRWSERQKTSKDSKGVSLACNPIEVAEPVVAHINSTAYLEEATNTGKRKDAFYFYGKRIGMLMT